MNAGEHALFALAQVLSSTTKPVFIHRLDAEQTHWHYGECFPDVDSCAVPNGGDLDAQAM